MSNGIWDNAFVVGDVGHGTFTYPRPDWWIRRHDAGTIVSLGRELHHPLSATTAPPVDVLWQMLRQGSDEA